MTNTMHTELIAGVLARSNIHPNGALM